MYVSFFPASSINKDVINMLQRASLGSGSFYALSSCSYVNPSAIVCNVEHVCCICVTFHVARISLGIPRRASGAGLKISLGIYSTVVNSRVVPDVRTYVHNTEFFLFAMLSIFRYDAAPVLMRKYTPDMPSSR